MLKERTMEISKPSREFFYASEKNLGDLATIRVATERFYHYFVYLKKRTASTSFMEDRKLMETSFPGIVRVALIKDRAAFNSRNDYPTAVYWRNTLTNNEEYGDPSSLMKYHKMADLVLQFSFVKTDEAISYDVFDKFYLEHIELHKEF